MELINCPFCSSKPNIRNYFVQSPVPANYARVCCTCGARGPCVEMFYPDQDGTEYFNEEVMEVNATALKNNENAAMMWNNALGD